MGIGKIDYEAASKKFWKKVKDNDRQNPDGARIFTEFCPKCGTKLTGEHCPNSNCKFNISD